MTTREKYSKEFKLDAISLVLEQGYRQTEATRSLFINAHMLRRWIKECHNLGRAGFSRQWLTDTEKQQEIRRLREENRHLKTEKEI